MEPIGTILDSNIGNFVSRWYSNLVKTINQRNYRFEWDQFNNNYLVKYCDRFYLMHQIEIKLKFIYSNDTWMINLLHVHIFLEHRVKSRLAMWHVIVLAHSFSLIPDEWERGEMWIAFFFLRIPFRGHDLDTVDEDFNVSNDNREEDLWWKLVRKLRYIYINIYIYQLWQCLVTLVKKTCTLFYRLMVGKFCHHLLDNNKINQLNGIAFFDD